MILIDSLLDAISEETIAREVELPHNNARMLYHARFGTVTTFEEFSDAIGDYYQYHYSTCVAVGGVLSTAEACSRAKEIVEREYRRRGGIGNAFNDACRGANGGLRAILDTIADTLRTESAERYMRDVFDRHVAPNSFEQKVEIIRQFFAKCPIVFPPDIRRNHPEQYAHNYQELIRTYVSVLRQTWAALRRA